MSKHHSPLAQFEVHPLREIYFAGYDISFTNASLWMLLSMLGVLVFLGLGIRKKAMVPGRLQSMAELSYTFVASQVKDLAGQEGMRYFPLVFSMFMFVLFGNLLGMIPYSFTFTSHIIATFALALFLFLFLTILGFVRHGFHFFSLFLPSGTPLLIAPLMIIIEIFSYLSRPVSLSIRLCANMMAGHTVLKVIAGFVISLGVAGGWAPLGFMVALTGFEFLVSFLQAYIFTVLICVYLNDAIHLH